MNKMSLSYRTVVALAASALLACLFSVPVVAEEEHQPNREADLAWSLDAGVEEAGLGDEAEMSYFELLRLLNLGEPEWQQLGIQELQLKPRPTPTHEDFPLNCADFSSSYCSYYYPGTGCCCVAQAPPNTYCPDICI